MTHKKQTVYVLETDFVGLSNNLTMKEIKDVYTLTAEDLLALRKKWAGEGWDDGFSFADYARKETYLNNLTIE